MTLADAFLIVVGARIFGTVLLSLAAFAIGILIQRFIHSVVIIIVILGIPLVAGTIAEHCLQYTLTGWLCGVDFLRKIYFSGLIGIVISGSFACLFCTILIAISIKKHNSMVLA